MVDATTVVEGDPSAMICATMVTTPTTATLEKEVVATLSTEDDTGQQITNIATLIKSRVSKSGGDL